MLDLKTQLGEYLDHVVQRVDLEDLLEQRADTEPVRPIVPRKAPFQVPGWSYAAAAAVIVLLLIGGAAWLTRPSDAPPADVPPTTAGVAPTTVEVTPTTQAPITTDTTAVTATTLAAAPVVPPGEGPKFSFAEAVLPSDGDLGGSGEWFDGSLFVLSDDAARLFRSSDGFTWESVPGFPSSGESQDSMLQADDDRLVNVVIGGPIRINISANGEDWLSSTIDVPILGESNGAGEFSFRDLSNSTNSVLAVGPRGIVVAASMTLLVDGERFVNTLVGADEGVHVEFLDIDLDRGVMTVQDRDESSGEVSETREIDLNSTGFGRDYADILKAMTADPDWEADVDGIASMFAQGGSATAVVNYAWFSSDGASWQRLPITGPLDGDQFASVLATPSGFVATTGSGVVWESTNGTTWIEADSSRGKPPQSLVVEAEFPRFLVEWQGAVVEHIAIVSSEHSSEVWTLTDPPNRLFAAIPTTGMGLEISDLGLIGLRHHSFTEGPRGSTGAIEVLLSVDGTSWNRWEPSEFGQNPGRTETSIVGVGDDFVVIQVRQWDANENASQSLWVGTIP